VAGPLRLPFGTIEADAGRLTAASSSGAAGSSARAAGEAGEARAERRRLAAVWLSAGSAVAAMVGAAMVAVSWYAAARNGGATGGVMVGHAAAAQWLRTLPW